MQNVDATHGAKMLKSDHRGVNEEVAHLKEVAGTRASRRKSVAHNNNLR